MKNPQTNRILTILALSIALAPAGCVSKRTYDRDVTALLNKLEQGKGSSADSRETMEAKIRSKASVLNTLTDKYMVLEKNYLRARERLNSFNSDLENLKKDIAELKLVVSINIDKLRSTVANEMLIKIIDMEYRIDELLKKESEPMPEPTLESQTEPAQTP